MKKIKNGDIIRLNPLPGLEEPIEGPKIRDNRIRDLKILKVTKKTIQVRDEENKTEYKFRIDDLKQAYQNTPKGARKIMQRKKKEEK